MSLAAGGGNTLGYGELLPRPAAVWQVQERFDVCTNYFLRRSLNPSARHVAHTYARACEVAVTHTRARASPRRRARTHPRMPCRSTCSPPHSTPGSGSVAAASAGASSFTPATSVARPSPPYDTSGKTSTIPSGAPPSVAGQPPPAQLAHDAARGVGRVDGVAGRVLHGRELLLARDLQRLCVCTHRGGD